MDAAQIKYMVARFLGWKLPENFNPDDGISFDPIMNKGHAFESRRQPSGTNLFDAAQADAMVRYMVEDMPHASADVVTDQMVDAACRAWTNTDSARFAKPMRRVIEAALRARHEEGQI